MKLVFEATQMISKAFFCNSELPACTRVSLEQIRPMQPDAPEASDEDSLELMEMILGALGRDAVGLGAR